MRPMTVFWVMLLRPFLYIVFIAPFVAFALWRVRRMKPGKLRSFLLWPSGDRSSARKSRTEETFHFVGDEEPRRSRFKIGPK